MLKGFKNYKVIPGESIVTQNRNIRIVLNIN